MTGLCMTRLTLTTFETDVDDVDACTILKLGADRGRMLAVASLGEMGRPHCVQASQPARS